MCNGGRTHRRFGPFEHQGINTVIAAESKAQGSKGALLAFQMFRNLIADVQWGMGLSRSSTVRDKFLRWRLVALLSHLP
jgi:hypothetical protein